MGTVSHFSFNDPNGMCQACSGLGKVTQVNMGALIDPSKSWNEGCLVDSLYKPGSWYWRQYAESGLFDLDKPIQDYSTEEHNLDVMKRADWIIDVGTDGGTNGGKIVFAGTPADMLRTGETLTADSLKASCADARLDGNDQPEGE